MSGYLNDDMVVACADLAGRAGASEFQIGFVHDDVPSEDAGWYAHAQYRGARLTAKDHRSPTGAALALSERILSGATCRCGQRVTLSDGAAGCRWQLLGRRWEPGCDAPTITVPGGVPGDYTAMQAAFSSNRAERRAARKGKGKPS
jgi:hypothetical protein